MDSSTHRVISISLNEQDWQALVRLHPQPQVWLRERIQESIAANASGAPNGRTLPVGVDVIAPQASAAGAANTTSATTR